MDSTVGGDAHIAPCRSFLCILRVDVGIDPYE